MQNFSVPARPELVLFLCLGGFVAAVRAFFNIEHLAAFVSAAKGASAVR